MFLQRFPITCVFRVVKGTGMRNTARLWPGANNLVIRQDHFEHACRAKNQMAVFQLGTREGIKVT